MAANEVLRTGTLFAQCVTRIASYIATARRQTQPPRPGCAKRAEGAVDRCKVSAVVTQHSGKRLKILMDLVGL